MTWLDLLSLGAFAGLLVLAHKRGVILEITDLISIVVGGFFAFRTFRPLANGLHGSLFSGFSLGFLQKFCLLTVFIICVMVVFAVGLNFQRRAKEEHFIEKSTDERLGVIVGFFKAIILILLLLGLMFYNDAFPDDDTRQLKKGVVVSRLLGLSDFVKPIVYITAPSDLAEAFMVNGLDPNNRKLKKKKKTSKKKQKK